MAEPQIIPAAPAARAARTWSGVEIPKPKMDGGPPFNPAMRFASNRASEWVPVTPGRVHRGAVQAWDAGANAVVILQQVKDPRAGQTEREVRKALRQAEGTN